MATRNASIVAPHGYAAAGIACGIKRSGRPDLSVIVADRPAAAAGVFTTNTVKAAPVTLGAERLGAHGDRIRGILTVSGVANALTGVEGLDDNRRLLVAAERTLALPPDSLLPACTGVIGPRIPLDRALAGLGPLAAGLGSTVAAADRAAAAILTTDTTPKVARRTLRLADGRRCTVGGIAKGSGMIAPRLGPLHATTLAFLTTDAPATPPGLARLLAAEVDRTLNMVSVDGDTSTNDTVYVLANGAAGGRSADDDPAFQAAVGAVLEDLARAIARDGEGATKLLTVTVEGARSVDDARAASRAVVGSTLVKAAIFGADPNVGRIACALGYSGARIDPARIDVVLERPGAPVPLLVDGRPAPGLDNGAGAKVRRILQRLDEIPLTVRLHQGSATARAWGCDLSYAYVQINAAYRT